MVINPSGTSRDLGGGNLEDLPIIYIPANLIWLPFDRVDMEIILE